LVGAVLEEGADPGEPVGLLAVHQVGDDLEWTPSVGPFVEAGPVLGEAAQEGARDGRGAGQQRAGMIEVEGHG